MSRCSPVSLTLTLLNHPQGATNFAVYSSGATAVSLVFFTEGDLQAGHPTYEVHQLFIQ